MSNAQHHILSNYPLSAAYREKLETLFGRALAYVNVSELRQSSMPALINALRSLRGPQLTVAIEDESSFALVPVLKLLAAVSSSRRLQTIGPDGRVGVFGRADAWRAGVKLFGASVRSAASLVSVRRECRALLRERLIECVLPADGRVAYLNCNLWFGVKAGGSVGHISGVANALMDEGYQLDFFTVGGRLMVDSRANFRPLAAPEMLSLPFETTYYQFHRECIRQIRPVLEARRPSFLYQRMSLGNYTGVMLSRQLGIPLVLEYNGSEAWIAKNWGRPLRFHNAAVAAEDVCLRHAHVVVTVSDALARELESRGVERERIVMYPNCIDPRVFDPDAYTEADRGALLTSVGFAADDIVASFIGTFGQWHGVDVLAAAIRHMIDHEREFLDRSRLRFLLVGDGLKMPVVREILGKDLNGAYVRFTGLVPQKEAPRYLAASDILLSPHVKNGDGSAFFGSPTKLFEYMAMGKAIYASDLDQIGEVLANSLRVDAGSIVEPRDASSSVSVLGRPGSIDDLAVGLRFLAEKTEHRRLLGGNARREALAKYTWQHHVSAILNRLRGVG